MSSPGRFLTPTPHVPPQEPVFNRRQWISRLDKIFSTIYRLSPPFLDPFDHDKFSIKWHPLAIADDGSYSQPPQPCFFAPLPQEKINAHPVNLDFREDESSDDLHHEFKVNAEILTELAERTEDSLGSAIFLCYQLFWKFDDCPRIGLTEASDALQSLTPWSGYPPEVIFHHDFKDIIFGESGPKWYPIHAYELRPKCSLPHTMAVSMSAIQGEDKLLRGEVLTIVAAIRTKLAMPEFSTHRIIPVAVFSFMGNQHGRILYAHYNGRSLEVWMTALFDFTTLEKAEANFRIFLQHLANQPIGDTELSA